MTVTTIVMLGKDEVAGRIGVSTRKLELMVAAREFPPAVRRGKTVLWSEDNVNRWLTLQLAAQDRWFDEHAKARRVRAA